MQRLTDALRQPSRHLHLPVPSGIPDEPRRQGLRRYILYTVKKYPYIRGYFVASFPYFDGTGLRVRLYL